MIKEKKYYTTKEIIERRRHVFDKEEYDGLIWYEKKEVQKLISDVFFMMGLNVEDFIEDFLKKVTKIKK